MKQTILILLMLFSPLFALAADPEPKGAGGGTGGGGLPFGNGSWVTPGLDGILGSRIGGLQVPDLSAPQIEDPFVGVEDMLARMANQAIQKQELRLSEPGVVRVREQLDNSTIAVEVMQLEGVKWTQEMSTSQVEALPTGWKRAVINSYREQGTAWQVMDPNGKPVRFK